MVVAIAAGAVIVSFAVLAAAVAAARREFSDMRSNCKAVACRLSPEIEHLREDVVDVVRDAEKISGVVSAEAGRVRALGEEVREAKGSIRRIGRLVHGIRTIAALVSGNPFPALTAALRKQGG